MSKVLRMADLDRVQGLLEGYRPGGNAWLTSLTKKRLVSVFFAVGIFASALWNLAPTRAGQGVCMSFITFGGLWLLINTMGSQYWTSYCWTIVLALFIACFVGVWGFAFPANGSDFLPYDAPPFVPVFSGVAIFGWFVAYVISSQIGVRERFEKSGKQLLERVKILRGVIESRTATLEQKKEAADILKRELEAAITGVGKTAAVFSYNPSAKARVQEEAAALARKLYTVELEEQMRIRKRAVEEGEARLARVEGAAAKEILLKAVKKFEKENKERVRRRFETALKEATSRPDALSFSGSRLGGYLPFESRKRLNSATVVARLYSEYLLERLSKAKSLKEVSPRGRSRKLEAEGTRELVGEDGTPISLSTARSVTRQVLGDPTALAASALRRSQSSGKSYDEELRNLMHFLFANAVQEGFLKEVAEKRAQDVFEGAQQGIYRAAFKRLSSMTGKKDYDTTGSALELWERLQSVLPKGSKEELEIDEFLDKQRGVLARAVATVDSVSEGIGEVSLSGLYAFLSSYSRKGVDLEFGEGVEGGTSAAAETFDLLQRGEDVDDKRTREYFRGLVRYSEGADAGDMLKAAVYASLSVLPETEKERAREPGSTVPEELRNAALAPFTGVPEDQDPFEGDGPRRVEGRVATPLSLAVERAKQRVPLSRPSPVLRSFLQYLSRVQTSDTPTDDFPTLLESYRKGSRRVLERMMKEEAEREARKEEEEEAARISAMPLGRKLLRGVFRRLTFGVFTKKKLTREERVREIMRRLNPAKVRRRRALELRDETIAKDLGFLREFFVKTDGMTEEEFVETYGEEYVPIFRAVNNPTRREGLRKLIFNPDLLRIQDEGFLEEGETEDSDKVQRLYDRVRRTLVKSILSEERGDTREAVLGRALEDFELESEKKQARQGTFTEETTE